MTLKDRISNIIGIIVAVGTIIVSALGAVPADAQWYVWVGAVVIALLSWMMGKPGNLKKQ